MNPAAEDALDVGAPELVGQALWQAYPGLLKSPFGEACRRAMREGTRVLAEDFYPPQRRWYEGCAYPLDDGLGVFFWDVTERKQAELSLRAKNEKLEAIIHGSLSPMAFFNGPGLVYETFNDAYAKLVPMRELAGKSLLEAIPELEGSAFPGLLRKVFESGVPIRTHEELASLLNPATGAVEDRYFDSAISRVHDGEGRPCGVFVQATETTDRVLARRRIEQALASRDEFLSIASHELRTPIVGMKLQSQFLLRQFAKGSESELTPERLKELVSRMDKGLTRLSHLMDDMLDISRIRAGRLSIDPEPTELVSFVRQVMDRFDDELNAAAIPLTIEAEPPELAVSVDRFRMEQVITNLVTNAIRYAPGSPLAVSVGAEGGVARLVFQDQGKGIPHQDLERVFECFERLATETRTRGLGLGLYIVRQIVEAHGGRIHAESGQGRGARFVVRLPLLSAVRDS